MGLWHGVEYYEKEKLVGEEYYQQWSNVSSVLNFTYTVIFSRYKIIDVKCLKFVKMLRFVVDCYVANKRLGIICI